MWSITRREVVDGNHDLFGAFSCFAGEGKDHWSEGDDTGEANDVTLSVVGFGDDDLGRRVCVKYVLTIFQESMGFCVGDSVVVENVDSDRVAVSEIVQCESHVGKRGVEEVNEDRCHGDNIRLFGEHGCKCVRGKVCI